MFFESKIEVRITAGTGAKIEELLNKYPNKYDNQSHLVRCAIIKLYNEEVGKNG